MIRDLIPWNQLTRMGVPALKVTRRPLVLGEVIVPVGETLDPELLPLHIRQQRLRQFYEQRLLEPVDAPPDSRQFYREQLARMHGHEIPVTPVTPVATRIVADNLPLPSVDVPVPESDPAARRKPKGAK
jgi:hypothetical protein